MDKLITYLTDIKTRINEKYILINIIGKNRKVQNYIIELNTIEQLYNKGIDSQGKSLGSYSPFTVKEKIKKGQPTDRVTLKDTGEFYKSFQIDLSGDDIIIEADTIKIAWDGAQDLLDIYGDDILGLTNRSLDKLINTIRIETQDFFRKNIFKV